MNEDGKLYLTQYLLKDSGYPDGSTVAVPPQRLRVSDVSTVVVPPQRLSVSDDSTVDVPPQRLRVSDVQL
jgi:hypothetical protein